MQVNCDFFCCPYISFIVVCIVEASISDPNRTHPVIPNLCRHGNKTEIERQRQRNRETEKQRNRETEKQRNRETEKQKNRKTEKQKNRKTEKQKNRKTENRKTQRYTYSNTETL